MAEIKRYFWLKLNHDFFNSKRIKKLRKLAGGDTFTIIYLKMQLLSLKTDGILTFTGLEKTFAEEIALDIDEDVDNVSVTIQYLLSCGLIETADNTDYFLPYVADNTGSETAAAQRVRAFRDRQKALHCNTDVTDVKHLCNVEKESEKETEKEKKYIGENCAKAQRFTPPTVDEVKDYCWERANSVDAQEFVDFYSAKGWMIGKNKMKDWKAAVRTWEKNKRNDTKKEKSLWDEWKDL